ncbi:hypothetical protein CABS01_16852 [Colletotrichum abscissum]|uniref:uncharacterized protein n=1 Tax=Colletotrichum abscissum TaxID=1671311 RepID=UPI0027D5A005|nr:uncharacterized protein CABS01_16852 [Colletotrichum abscissum]KAK1509298.1 hypothetical protein CABS01_16852 [Colletotrichum abscissum]
MPLWICDWELCRYPAVQRDGDCLLCRKHLCRTHLREPWHACPRAEENWEAYSLQYAAAEAHDLDQLRRKINVSKLCSRASMIRNGIPCVVDLSTKQLASMMGNQNCHAEIAFEDGVVWIARFRITKATSPPQEVRDFIIRSEAATMSYLCQNTRLPVPRIYDWSDESNPENNIGVSYILMEKLDGRPLDWRAATPTQREKIMQQVADIYIEIERHPFGSMGSLVTSSRNPHHLEVQGLAQHTTYQSETGHALGPFSSPVDGSAAIIETYLTMIASGELIASRPIDAYLTHRFRLDVIDRLWTGSTAEKRFFLKHPDDKGDHILVNDDFDIVGIIDWEWTRTVSSMEAFCSPSMMWPISKFYAGSNELAQDELRLAEVFREKGREDLSEHILTGRKVQRFFFAMGPESPSDVSNFTSLFAGLAGAFDYEHEEWERWKNEALNRWKDDNQLRNLVQQDGEKEG